MGVLPAVFQSFPEQLRLLGPSCGYEPRGAVVAWGKKNRRKKKGGKSLNRGSETQPVGEAPRVLANCNKLSVRTQIRLVRQFEAQQDADAKAAVRFRGNSKLAPAQAIRKQVQTSENRRREQDLLESASLQLTRPLSYSPDLQQAYKTAARRDAPAVIVDGYNVLFYVYKQRVLSAKGGVAAAGREAEEKRYVILSRQYGLGHQAESYHEALTVTEMETLRQQLEDRVEAYCSAAGFRAVLVWDMNRGAPGDSKVEHRSELLRVVSIGTMEADTYLRVAAHEYLIELGAEYVLVVTSDAEARELATQEKVYTVKTETFVEEMRVQEVQTQKVIEEANAEAAAVVAAVPGGAGDLFGSLIVERGQDKDKLLALMSGFDTLQDKEEAEKEGLAPDAFYRRRMKQQQGV